MANRKWKVRLRDAYPEYITWRNIRQRCLNEKNLRDYPLYGGAGIGVCREWSESFDVFLEDMGKRPGKGYSIDRIDNLKGYSKENCRWATSIEQNNNRRSNRLIDVGGRTLSLAEAERTLGLPRGRIKGRLNKGISENEALSSKLLTRFGSKHPASKLTDLQVVEIREWYSKPRKKGDLAKKAAELGVHRHTIQYIAKGLVRASA